MVGIVEVIQLGVLLVDGKGVLCQIIAPQGEEVRFLRQSIRHHHSGRGSNFNPTGIQGITVRSPM